MKDFLQLPDRLSAFLSGSVSAICQDATGRFPETPPWPQVIFPGSFNPLHHGHTTLAAVASQRLGLPVAFELSLANVDKPTLPEAEIRRRLSQFIGLSSIWTTRAPTFLQKAELFPNAVFVVGHDTAVRLIDPRYYHADESQRDRALHQLCERGCRFLVGGRVQGTQFHTWDMKLVKAEFRELFLALHEQDFRVDCSSTELRNG